MMFIKLFEIKFIENIEFFYSIIKIAYINFS